MITLDRTLIEAARQGSRAALDGVVRALQRPIYNLSLRMLACPADADDAAQEIIIKIITNLGDLREVDAAGGWAMRIAMRHLTHRRALSRVEAMRMSFRAFGADLQDGLEQTPDLSADDPDRSILAAQVKIGCTLAMLTCLSRPLRAAYILSEVYETPERTAAAILDIDYDAYRQRLRRARALVAAFTQKFCGLVSDAAPCRCPGRVARAQALGRVSAAMCAPEAAAHDLSAIRQTIAALDHGRRSAALMASNPDFAWRALDLLDAMALPPP